jgi:hypothetical protein
MKEALFDYYEKLPHDIVSIGPEQKGFSSSGRRVCTKNQELFVLQGPNDPYKLQRANLDLPHFPRVYSICPIEENSMRIIMDALPVEATPLLSVLRRVGLHTIQTEENGEIVKPIAFEDLSLIYSMVIDSLVDVHNTDKQKVFTQLYGQEMTLPIKKKIYQESQKNIIVDSQRLDGIARVFFSSGGASTITQKDYLTLRSKMVLQSNLQTDSSRLAIVHGDAWAANIFLEEKPKEQKKIHFIDPAILFSDPALDVTFSLFDVAAIYGHSGEPSKQKYLQLADSLVSMYIDKTKDYSIRKNMALFYGYKSFVSSIFDVSNNLERQKDILNAGIGALISTVENGEEFYFQQFDKYKELGEKNSKIVV